MGKKFEKFEDLTPADFFFTSPQDLIDVARLYHDFKKREIVRIRKLRLGKERLQALKKEAGYSFALDAVARMAKPAPFLHWEHARGVLEKEFNELRKWQTMSVLGEYIFDLMSLDDVLKKSLPDAALKSLLYMGNKHFPESSLDADDFHEHFSEYAKRIEAEHNRRFESRMEEMKREAEATPLTKEEKKDALFTLKKILTAAKDKGKLESLLKGESVSLKTGDLVKAFLGDTESRRAQQRESVKASLKRFGLMEEKQGTDSLKMSERFLSWSRRTKAIREELLLIEDLDERRKRAKELSGENQLELQSGQENKATAESMKHESLVSALIKQGLKATPDPESQAGYHSVDAGEWIGSWYVGQDQSISSLWVRKKPVWAGGRPADNKDIMDKKFTNIESFVAYIVERQREG